MASNRKGRIFANITKVGRHKNTECLLTLTEPELGYKVILNKFKEFYLTSMQFR